MRFALLGLVLLGCSSHTAAPPAAPEAGDRKEELATTTTTKTNGPCLATTAREAPAGWTPSGAILVAMKGGHPSQLTVTDGGKTLATETPVNERKIGEQIKSLACKANAWLAIPDKATMTPSEVTFQLYRPSKNDEAADVAMLCTLPKEAADPSADESQRAIIAAQLYGERLTSVRYRSWFFDLDRALGAAATDTDRVTVKQSHGEKLDVLLKSDHAPDRCWFAKVLAAAKP